MTYKDGHRDDYQRVLSETLGLEPSLGKVSVRNVWALVRAKALLFGSLDDDVRGFVLVAFVRMLAGRKTVGLFLRPQSCFTPVGGRSVLKRALFHGLSQLPLVSICTILPFEVEPRYRKIASHGLADPQLWDRKVLPFDPSAEFAEQLKDWARGRRIMAFIGTASPFKGVAQIREMMVHPEWNNSVCVIFAGRVPDETLDLVEDLKSHGAVVIARFVSNPELDALYEVADFIWAGYQPGYDQASGNFGRAIQSGQIPVVREGTLIERFARNIGYPVVAINFDDLRPGISRLQGPLLDAAEAPAAQIQRWQDEFMAIMADSL